MDSSLLRVRDSDGGAGSQVLVPVSPLQSPASQSQAPVRSPCFSAWAPHLPRVKPPGHPCFPHSSLPHAGSTESQRFCWMFLECLPSQSRRHLCWPRPSSPDTQGQVLFLSPHTSARCAGPGPACLSFPGGEHGRSPLHRISSVFLPWHSFS